MKEKKKVVLLVLPAFLLLLFSVSYAINSESIQATLTVVPTTFIQCKPDVLTVGSGVKWINCFISLEGADLSDIDLTTVKLSVDRQSGSVTADQTFFKTGDFLNLGINQAMVRFSRSQADANWFKVTSDTTFTLIISGNLKSDGLPFSGTDSILIKKIQTKKLVDYRLSDKANTIKFLRVEGFNLAAYTPTRSNFNEFFVIKEDPNSYGTNGFYSSGYVVTPYTIKFLGMDITLYKRVTYTIAALFNKYDDCSINESPVKINSKIHCEGSGVLLIMNRNTGQYTRQVMETMRFDVENRKGTIEGGHVWNDMFSVKDINLDSLRINALSTK